LKNEKIIWFLMAVIGLAVVIFNNTIDLYNKMFKPWNVYYSWGLVVAIIISGVYWIHNWRNK